MALPLAGPRPSHGAYGTGWLAGTFGMLICKTYSEAGPKFPGIVPSVVPITGLATPETPVCFDC